MSLEVFENYECDGQLSIEEMEKPEETIFFKQNNGLTVVKEVVEPAQEITFSEETMHKFKEIFHEMPVVANQNETEKYLREIAQELKKIRLTMERRR